MKKTDTEEGLIYDLGDKGVFRVIQLNEKDFTIQRMYIRSFSKRYFLFFNKKVETREWHRISYLGSKSRNFLTEFDSLDEAKKWISKFDKYPIIY